MDLLTISFFVILGTGLTLTLLAAMPPESEKPSENPVPPFKTRAAILGGAGEYSVVIGDSSGGGAILNETLSVTGGADRDVLLSAVQKLEEHGWVYWDSIPLDKIPDNSRSLVVSPTDDAQPAYETPSGGKVF